MPTNPGSPLIFPAQTGISYVTLPENKSLASWETILTSSSRHGSVLRELCSLSEMPREFHEGGVNICACADRRN